MSEFKPLFDQQLLTEREVDEKISLIALEIRGRYKEEHPVFVCLLKGGAPFAAKLMFEIVRQDPYFHPELDYMVVSTYKDERAPQGETRIIMDLSPETRVRDRKVAVLDDVSDSNQTIAATEKHLLELHGASSVDVIVLADKAAAKTSARMPDLVGFRAPDRWLTGMGMDDAEIASEANRWMGSIALSEPIE